jgi:hypothetical protein
MSLKTDIRTWIKALLRGHEPFSFRDKEKAVTDAILWANLYNGGFKPGEAYLHLPEEIKQKLRDCKSKDWNHRI